MIVHDWTVFKTVIVYLLLHVHLLFDTREDQFFFFFFGDLLYKKNNLHKIFWVVMKIT